MNIKKVVKMFENGNVSVCGVKGSGKDILFSNVIARRKGLEYVSNINYGYKFNAFNVADFDVKNNYLNFLNNDINRYKFPFPDKTDLYLSDCGIYFPAQYHKELDKLFSGVVTFQALSRHVGLCNVHTNSQACNRVYDKLREQSDQNILCLSCKVFCGFVFQKIRIYEKYESCLNKVAPFRYIMPLFAKQEVRENIKLKKVDYTNSHGVIKECLLIYKHKGTYDTRYFKKLLKKEGIAYEENEF